MARQMAVLVVIGAKAGVRANAGLVKTAGLRAKHRIMKPMIAFQTFNNVQGRALKKNTRTSVSRDIRRPPKACAASAPRPTQLEAQSVRSRNRRQPRYSLAEAEYRLSAAKEPVKATSLFMKYLLT